VRDGEVVAEGGREVVAAEGGEARAFHVASEWAHAWGTCPRPEVAAGGEAGVKFGEARGDGGEHVADDLQADGMVKAPVRDLHGLAVGEVAEEAAGVNFLGGGRKAWALGVAGGGDATALG